MNVVDMLTTGTQLTKPIVSFGTISIVYVIGYLVKHFIEQHAALQATNHKIKVSELHEIQVEALGQIYEVLADCQDAINNYTTEAQGKNRKKKIAHQAAKWDQSFNDFTALVDRKNIYLSSEICVTLENLVSELSASKITRNQGIKNYVLKDEHLPAEHLQILITTRDNIARWRKHLKDTARLSPDL